MRRLVLLAAPLFTALSAPLLAQQPIGRTSASEVKVAGAVEVNNGQMVLGNGSTVTAGDHTVAIALTRGGDLRLCQTTSVHLAKDKSIDDPASTALMMALDRGALEASYSVGKYSDVLLTPDLRILISGPGKADLAVRVNAKGDTCVDNRGANAPYVIVSSQLEGGIYRIQPGQRVLFEHGSLREVVDHEPEPCGCPTPTVSIATAGTTAATPAQAAQPGQVVAPTTQPSKAVGGPSSTPADTAFPLAQSEGLTPAPTATAPAVAAPITQPAPEKVQPVVPAGETHAQVTAPLTYNGEAPAAAPVTPAPAAAPGVTAAPPPKPQPRVTTPPPPAPAPRPTPAPTPPPPPAPAPAAPTTTAVAQAPPLPPPEPGAQPAHQQKDLAGMFRSIGHLFKRMFGG